MVLRAGGAWIIGYQAWGALLARRLSLRGAVVCCVDYRNFPQVHFCCPASGLCRNSRPLHLCSEMACATKRSRYISHKNLAEAQGTIADMLQDCDTAIQWVSDNIHRYGGDPDNIYIAGQSAGAHISSLCLFAQVISSRHMASHVLHPSLAQVCWASLRSIGSLFVNLMCFAMADSFHRFHTMRCMSAGTKDRTDAGSSARPDSCAQILVSWQRPAA